MRWWRWINGMTMGPMVLLRYLKLSLIKCNCVRSP
jgi:hypothetical protein